MLLLIGGEAGRPSLAGAAVVAVALTLLKGKSFLELLLLKLGLCRCCCRCCCLPVGESGRGLGGPLRLREGIGVRRFAPGNAIGWGRPLIDVCRFMLLGCELLLMMLLLLLLLRLGGKLWLLMLLLLGLLCSEAGLVCFRYRRD